MTGARMTRVLLVDDDDAIRTVVAPLAIAGCCYLFTSLQVVTQVAFLGWNAFGLLVYFLYARGRAQIA